MDLEQTLTSRDKINTMLRGVLDEASGRWGIRVTRVEIKAIDPAPSIMDAMEKQYRAQREKRAAILVAEGEKQAAILKSEGQAGAIRRSSRRSMKVTRTRSCSLTNTCRRCRRSRKPGQHGVGDPERGDHRPEDTEQCVRGQSWSD